MFRPITSSSAGIRIFHPFVAFLIAALALGALPVEGQVDYLQIFRGAIDVTGFKLQIQATIPDRDSGDMVRADLPAGLLGPKMKALLATPLSDQLAKVWSSTTTSGGVTLREAACSQLEDALKKKAPIEGHVGCYLTSSGRLYYQQTGTFLQFGYLLQHNVVGFKVNLPYALGQASPPALAHPSLTATFDIMIAFSLSASNLCGLTASNASAYVSSVQVSGDAGGEILLVLQDILGNGNSELEKAVNAVSVNLPESIDPGLQELRAGGACSGANPIAFRAVQLFGDFEINLDSRAAIKKIVLGVTYPKIAAPKVDVPNPAARTLPPPSLFPATISSDKPSVVAGGGLQISGRYFAPNPNYSTQLPITITHAGSNSALGTCYGGATELMWGPPTEKNTTERLPGMPVAACANSYTASPLTPGRAYQFKARDCDLVTCSQWSPIVTSITDIAHGTTLGGDSIVGRFGFVSLNLDGTDALGSANVDSEGAFSVLVTVPGSVTPGFHQIRAYHQFKMVAASPILVNPVGMFVTPSIMVVGVLNGDNGCPFRPITSTAADSDFWLFGQGFTRGIVVIRLDSATAPLHKFANVDTDGTFCADISPVGSSNAGTHTIFATQRTAVAQTTMNFVVVSPVH
jgi:hypothetical protein